MNSKESTPRSRNVVCLQMHVLQFYIICKILIRNTQVKRRFCATRNKCEKKYNTEMNEKVEKVYV